MSGAEKGGDQAGPGVNWTRKRLGELIANPELRAAVETHFAVWAESESVARRLDRVAVSPEDFVAIFRWVYPSLAGRYLEPERSVRVAELFFGIGLALGRGRR